MFILKRHWHTNHNMCFNRGLCPLSIRNADLFFIYVIHVTLISIEYDVYGDKNVIEFNIDWFE